MAKNKSKKTETDNVKIILEKKVVERKVFFYYTDGSKVIDKEGKHAVAVQSAEFSREVRTDSVSGKVEYGEWAETVFKGFPAIKVKGYTPNMLNIPEVVVSPDKLPTDLEVYYFRDEDDVDLPGIVRNIGGIWTFCRGENPDNSYTGVAKSTLGRWIFVKNGIWDPQFTGLAQSTKGNWIYVNKGRWDFKYNGIADLIGSEKKCYVTDGRWNKTYTGEYKGVFIEDGVVVDKS